MKEIKMFCVTAKRNFQNGMLLFTAPFNNMRTLKFKIQSTVTLFTAVNHCSGPLRKQNVWLNRVKRSCSDAVIGGF